MTIDGCHLSTQDVATAIRDNLSVLAHYGLIENSLQLKSNNRNNLGNIVKRLKRLNEKRKGEKKEKKKEKKGEKG